MTVGRRFAACIVSGIFLAAALVSPCHAKEKAGKKTADLPPEEVYAEALRKIDKKRYYSARMLLQQLLPRIPPEDRDLLPRVQMSLADAFFRDGGLANYGEALNAYRNFLTYFPQNEKAAYAQLMVGQSLYRQVPAPDRDQTTTMKALEELRKVETAWPDSPWAAEARELMELCYNRLAEKERLVGRFYQQRKQWLAALDRYRMVTEAYPRYDGMSRLLYEMGRCQLAVNRREEAQESFTRLAQRDDSEKLVKLANLATRRYDKRREKEGEQLYGDLSGQDGKKKGNDAMSAGGSGQRPARRPLTAIVPTFNEEESLPDCLDSVRFADEVLVVDSFSADRTLEIARERGARVIQRQYGYSAQQKNWAIPQAAHEWILLVDADERVTPALRDEIMALLAAGPRADGYWIRRANFFMGRRIRRCGWGGDTVIRLFRRDASRYQDRRVHAEIDLPGPLPTLAHPLEHHTFRSFAQYWRKLDLYSDWGARQMYLDGRRTGGAGIVLRTCGRFIRMYVLKLGFLEGAHGVVLSLFGAFTVYLKYARLWELQLRGKAPDAAAAGPASDVAGPGPLVGEPADYREAGAARRSGGRAHGP